jgi:curved DNA-binding protein
MATEDENLYGILGVKSTSTQAEIQAAFKQKARELHPDVNKAPDAEENFKRLAAAYAILRDEEKRARYDKYGFSDGRPPPAPGGRPGPRSRAPSTSGRRRYTPRDFGFEDLRYEDIRADLGDLKNPFEFFMERERRKREQKKAKEREVSLSISMEHAFKGTTLNMLLDLPDERGAAETRRIRLKIPQGAKEGDRLKLKEPEVTVILKVEPHPRFQLNGRDLEGTLDLSPWEAALGSTVELETPGGAVKIKVPEGSSSGQRLRLRGQGLPLKPGREGEPGDLYVTLKISAPKQLSPRERELLEELQKISTFDPRRT